MNKLKGTLFNLFVICMINAQDVPVTIEPYVFEANNGEKIDAELGTIIVPIKRSEKNTKKLNLKFVRFKSTNPNPGNPIVYLAGGPGGSGIGAARGSRFPLFMAMRDVADVIAFDQRGTGMSDGPPRYPGFWTIDPRKATDRKEAAQIIKDETKRAVEFFKDKEVDIKGYNTNESADDLNDLRLALGAEKLNLWGISYGTHLSLTYLKRYEPQVDRMILAGVEGYDHTVKLPSDQEALLMRINTLLKSNAQTKRTYPNFLGQIECLLNQLEKEPTKVITRNPMNGSEMEVVIGKFDLQMIIAWTLRGPETFKDLPWMVSEMTNGNFNVLSEYALYTHLGRFRGMSMAMDIASGISEERLVRLNQEKESTLLGDAINYPYLEQREAFQGFDLGEEFRAPFKSSIPVLCISGTLDGRTSVENAIETLEHLPNGRHLILDGAGHSDPLFLGSPKILEEMMKFMKGEEVDDQTIRVSPFEFKLK